MIKKCNILKELTLKVLETEDFRCLLGQCTVRFTIKKNDISYFGCRSFYRFSYFVLEFYCGDFTYLFSDMLTISDFDSNNIL